VARADLEEYMKAHNVPGDRLPGREALVLVVDDVEAELAASVNALSDGTAWRVESTRSGFEAGLKTMDLKPDVLVLDVFLRDRDGREVARRVRADPRLAATRILVVTGAQEDSIALEALLAGADAFLRKPFAPEQLRAAVRKLLS
ncbi:MAG: response regulator, partial [Elusimicrobia bacterium]|nr:response regulator [Elusimicrobiota bacterium]